MAFGFTGLLRSKLLWLQSKPRWVILFLFLLIAGCLVTSFNWYTGAARREVNQIRKSLFQQGFELDLCQFDLTASPEQAARAVALTNAANGCRTANARSIQENTFMPTLGSNAAIVLWQQSKWNTAWAGNDWAALREELKPMAPMFESACGAALSGPIKFSPVVKPSSDTFLPHLSDLKILSSALGSYIMLDLHDKNHARAWTNLLGLTRLTTAWQPESSEISHIVRFRLATIARNITWQVLQAGDSTDSQLSTLQSEWESPDYFKSLPETAALSRASMLGLCINERQQPLVFSYKDFFKEIFQSPRSAWANAKAIYHEIDYRRSGLYEDEKALMLYFRDRELELREVIKAPTWSAMTQLPGANPPPFKSTRPSRIAALMNLKRMALNLRAQQTLAANAADAEVRRRLVIAALAVERFRLQSGHYPDSLQQLLPHFLSRLPIDFIDGQPLRYFHTVEDHFVLYSIGFNGIDNHGIHSEPAKQDDPELVSRPRLRRSFNNGSRNPLTAPSEYDAIWPRPATPAEVERFQLSIPTDE